MALKVSQSALDLYHQIKAQINIQDRNYRLLMIKCYICNKTGHIAKDCKQFYKIKGNLKKYMKELFNISADTDSQGKEDQIEAPIMVSLASNSEHLPQVIEDMYSSHNQ